MISREDLVALSDPKDGLAVSFFLPTQRVGKPTRENPIRLKNRIVEARSYLESRGWDTKDIDALLAPALQRLDDYDFWQHQQDGLALFMTEGEKHELQVERELPDLTVIGRRFHLKPLMPLLNEQGGFFVLAASLGKSRLFEANREEARELELPEDTPRSLEQALRFDDPEQSVRWHTAERAGGDLTAMYYGSGAGDRDKKMDVLRFFRMLDNGVRQVIEGTEKPLLFMGVEYLYSLYREANHYPHFLEEKVEGNPDYWDANEVREHAWEAVRERFERPRREAAERYRELQAKGEADRELDKVMPAAAEGRVDTLFVALDEQRWGRYDAQSRDLRFLEEATPEGEDLLDRAAVETLRHGGKVFAVPSGEVPSGSEVAAIYRF